jgi:hypothetical protein
MNVGNVTQAGLGTLGSGAALGGLLSGGMAAIPGWGWAALAAANLLPAILGSSAQERQRKREAQLRAAEIEASPWTGRGPSTQMQTPESNVWANLLGAGTNVLGQGQAIESARRNAALQEQQMNWNQMMMNKMIQSNEDPYTLMFKANTMRSMANPAMQMASTKQPWE